MGPTTVFVQAGSAASIIATLHRTNLLNFLVHASVRREKLPSPRTTILPCWYTSSDIIEFWVELLIQAT